MSNSKSFSDRKSPVKNNRILNPEIVDFIREEFEADYGEKSELANNTSATEQDLAAARERGKITDAQIQALSPEEVYEYMTLRPYHKSDLDFALDCLSIATGRSADELYNAIFG